MPVYQEKNKNKLPKNGNSWYFRCYYIDIYGNKKQMQSKMYKSKTIAKDEELKFLTSIKNNTNEQDIYFEEMYNSWWEVKKKKLKITNANNLKLSLDKNILAFFKPFKLKSITIKVMNEYLNWLDNKDLTINYKNCMISYCKECFLYGTIYYNFDIKIANCLLKFRNDVPKDKPKDSEYNFWTLDEFNKFIQNVNDYYYKIVFTFLYRTGLRIGEFKALNWNDIDLNNKTLSISKELVHGLIITPKTENSIRIIDLDNYLVKMLKEYKKTQEKLYGFNDKWFVFGGIKNTSNTTLRRHLDKYIKISNVKHITIHGFRHSHVSLLIYLGCDSRDVAERIGDTVQTVERTYYHMFPKKKKETVQKLNDISDINGIER